MMALPADPGLNTLQAALSAGDSRTAMTIALALAAHSPAADNNEAPLPVMAYLHPVNPSCVTTDPTAYAHGVLLVERAAANQHISALMTALQQLNAKLAEQACLINQAWTAPSRAAERNALEKLYASGWGHPATLTGGSGE